MRYIQADHIVTVSHGTIPHGIIEMDEKGTIQNVLHHNPDPCNIPVEQFKGTIVPGFVNTHCHLELSHLKGKLAEKTGLHQFIRNIEQFRYVNEEDILKGIEAGEQEMIRNGIVAVGDISNNHLSFTQKAKANLWYHTFLEVFAFNPARAHVVFAKGLHLLEQYKETVHSKNVSISPHAPYSASKELLKKIHHFAEDNRSILSIHNQENEEENKFFLNKSGRFADHMKHFGIDISEWEAPGTSSLVATLTQLPNENKLLLVHNTFTSGDDVDFCNGNHNHLYWCLCPNANLYIENRLPDIPMLLEKGCRITLGTDSLASNWSLSILDEIKAIHKYYPLIPFETLIKWGTLNGAEFLGIDKKFGSIEKGKRPGLVLLEGDIESQNFEHIKIKRLL